MHRTSPRNAAGLMCSSAESSWATIFQLICYLSALHRVLQGVVGVAACRALVRDDSSQGAVMGVPSGVHSASDLNFVYENSSAHKNSILEGRHALNGASKQLQKPMADQ